MQDIILLRGQELSYAREKPSLKDRIIGNEGELVLKDVSFTLYKGEVLGVLSTYDTLYYLKEIIGGTVNQKKGKVKSEHSILSLDVMDHVNHPHSLKTFLGELFDEYLNPARVSGALDSLSAHNFVQNAWERPVSQLTRREIALILIEVSLLVDVEIVIFCNLYNHLKQSDYNFFKTAINTHEEREHGVLLLESEIEPIRLSANYFLWLSYGQVRYDGSVQKGVQQYEEYLRAKSQVKNVDEEALFDLEWKRNVSEHARYKHDLKRLSVTQSSIIDTLNVRRIILSLLLLFIMVMAGLVIFMNIDFNGEESRSIGEDTTVTPSAEEDEMFVYGIVKDEALNIGGETLPEMSLVTVSGRDEENYTVSFNGETYDVPHDELIYFNPASLYTETTLDTLLPYTHQSFSDSHEFYTRDLNSEIEQITERFDLESSDEYHASLAGIPITYHFRDGYVLGISFPATDIDELYSEFSLSEEEQIFRLQNGYMILDGDDETWMYINR